MPKGVSTPVAGDSCSPLALRPVSSRLFPSPSMARSRRMSSIELALPSGETSTAAAAFLLAQQEQQNSLEASRTTTHRSSTMQRTGSANPLLASGHTSVQPSRQGSMLNPFAAAALEPALSDMSSQGSRPSIALPLKPARSGLALDTMAWHIAFDEIQCSRIIGEGSFGRVYLGELWLSSCAAGFRAVEPSAWVSPHATVQQQSWMGLA